MLSNKRYLLLATLTAIGLHGLTGMGIAHLSFPDNDIAMQKNITPPLEVTVITHALPPTLRQPQNTITTDASASPDTPNRQSPTIRPDNPTKPNTISSNAIKRTTQTTPVVNPSIPPSSNSASYPSVAPSATVRPTPPLVTTKATTATTTKNTATTNAVTTPTASTNPATVTPTPAMTTTTNAMPATKNSLTTPTVPTTKVTVVAPTVTTSNTVAKTIPATPSPKPPVIPPVNDNSPVVFSAGQASWKNKPNFDCAIPNVSGKKFTVTYTVSKQGSITNTAFSSSGNAKLDNILSQTARNASFRAHLKNGQPVIGKVIVPITCP